MRAAFITRRLLPSALAALVALLVVLAGEAASAATYSPLGRPGPKLAPSAAALKASLTCEPGVRNAKVEPVLLSPGTSATAKESFAWNWEPALDMLGIPWCAYTAPHQTLDRIDVSGEYIVHAIRTMHALAGRRIAILGWSQGGMSMRWSLRFWPDTRRMVADVIGMEPSNQGTKLINNPMCALLGCPPADWQQIWHSPFIEALNSRAETFDGISYTNVYSTHDEVVIPNSKPSACGSCVFTGAGRIANIKLQSICPLDVSDHVLAAATDPVTYRLVVDALTHAGPASAARIPKSVCRQLLMPGVATPQSAEAATTLLESVVGTLGILPGPVKNPVSGAPVLHKTPPLPSYVYATGS